MANLTGEVYDPTDEWLKEHFSGWIEKREGGNVVATLRSHYRIVPPSEDKKIIDHEYYLQTTEKDFDKKSTKAVFYKAIYKDIFKSHLSLLTQSVIFSDVLMEILLHFPNHQSELMFIANVTRVDSDMELGRDIYHAHLKAIAINQKSINEMILAINRNKS